MQIENLRKQAEDQEASLLAQEEEVHGKQKELDALKEEEKKLLEEIKASEKEIQKLSHDLDVSSEINTEVKGNDIINCIFFKYRRQFFALFLRKPVKKKNKDSI